MAGMRRRPLPECGVGERCEGLAHGEVVDGGEQGAGGALCAGAPQLTASQLVEAPHGAGEEASGAVGIDVIRVPGAGLGVDDVGEGGGVFGPGGKGSGQASGGGVNERGVGVHGGELCGAGLDGAGLT